MSQKTNTTDATARANKQTTPQAGDARPAGGDASPPLLAGLDLGTTGCRCVLFDAGMRLRGESYYEYPLMTGPDNVVEQDAALWWELVCRTLREAAERAGASPEAIRAVSVSSQGITVVPVDREYQPLRPAINWLDNRPGGDGGSLLRRMGERYPQITARLSPASYGIGRLMWLQDHEPELMRRAHKILMPMDFVIARLCGEAVTDHSMAAGMGCYDMLGRCWSRELLDLAGVNDSLLPRITESGSVAGVVSAAAAAACGLAEGTPVVVGAQDQKCGGLAAGLADGVATVSLGTCLAVLVRAVRPVCDPQWYLPCFSDLFRDGYLLEGVLGVGAGCLKWYRDLYYPDRSYREVVELAGTHEPTAASPYFFPHLQGRGTPRRAACSGSFTGLTLDTDAAALAHSVLEGVSFGLRENLEAADKVSEKPVERLRVFGGGAKDRYWVQQIADVTGLPAQSLYTHEMPCAGAAILAGIGAGLFADAAEARALSVRVKDECVPDPGRHAVYSARYAEYLRLDRKFHGR